MHTFKVDKTIVEKELPDIYKEIMSYIDPTYENSIIWHYAIENNPPTPSKEVLEMSYDERYEYEINWFTFVLYYEVDNTFFKYNTYIIPTQVKNVIKEYVILLMDRESSENLSLDNILDKISKHGVDSLTKSEKTFLDNY